MRTVLVDEVVADGRRWWGVVHVCTLSGGKVLHSPRAYRWRWRAAVSTRAVMRRSRVRW